MPDITVTTVVKRTAIVLAVALVATVVYGVAVEPRLILEERRVDAVLPGLDRSWEGQQVAAFSDLQVGMWLGNTGMVERVVERVVELEPAAVLVPGDFLYGRSPDPPEQIEEVLRLLAPILEAQIPAFAVLGNHDYSVGASTELTVALEAAGVDVLLNESAVLPPPPGATGEPLRMVGLGPSRPPLADPSEALDDVPSSAPRLTMLHNPTAFPLLPPFAAPFAVAGHTHCGQVTLPGTPRWSYLALSDEEKVVADGFAPTSYGAPGNGMYVTCGIGFSLLPMRINAPPQLLLIDLVAADRPGEDADAPAR